MGGRKGNARSTGSLNIQKGKKGFFLEKRAGCRWPSSPKGKGKDHDKPMSEALPPG